MRILRAADRTAVPWKNGGGITREIAARPPGADTAGFEWRISLAEVAADGPFSAFPGVDRVLTMVEGAGMDLTLAGAGPETGTGPGAGTGLLRRVDARYVPQHFPGDVPTDCRLVGGPVVNLNVMYRRGAVDARVEVVEGDVELVPVVAGEGTRVVVPLDAVANFEHERTTSLAPYDAVVLTGAGGSAPYAPLGMLRTAGRTAVITLKHG